MSTASKIAQKIEKAWSSIAPPSHEDMKYFTVGWGKGEQHLFLDVKPVDVDRQDERFLVADVLAEMSPVATAAYLGPYLMTFFEDLAFQEKEGFFSEPMVRGSVLALLARPRTWSDVLRPNLPRNCKEALGDAVNYIVKSQEMLELDLSQIGSLEKLARSIARDIAWEP
ncbi:hypothetical protein [Mesorhizobium sp. 1B3]|uniref:hypothetical protein n=1 Tax=Mesorhizobium sp. 1B3 TaxID=3243599 RepID=UPI003D9895B1